MDWSDQVIKILDNLGQKFGIAIDWSKQNIVPYIQQLANKIITYKLSLAIVAVSISFLFMLISAIWIINANKKKKLFEYVPYNYESHRGGYFTNGNLRASISIMLLFLFILSFIVFVVNIIMIIKCVTIPDLVIFDTIGRLITYQQ